MANFKLTMSKLKVLKDNYYNTLKQAMNKENIELRKEVVYAERAELIKAKRVIMKGMATAGFKIDDIIEIDTSKSSWHSQKSHYDVTTITVKCYLPADKSCFPELNKKSNKNCEKWKKRFAELKDWELNCIKSGEIIDFPLPEKVDEEEIVCG